jgi:hypothetical protein
MEPYPLFTNVFPLPNGNLPPVILVGTVLSSVPVGQPEVSVWDGKTPYQRYRATVDVENVLRGAVSSQPAEIYFLVDRTSQGIARLGTLENHNGSWRAGDREMFFLQTDSGRLRIVCDTYAHCVAPVMSGSHRSFRPGKSTAEDIADILLTPGSQTSDEQMIKGLDKATSFSFGFAPNRAMKKLEELIDSGSPKIRLEACKYLRIYRHPFGQPEYPVMLSHDPAYLKAAASCSQDGKADRP